MNTNSNVCSLRSSAKGNLFVPRPNSNFTTPNYFMEFFTSYFKINSKHVDLFKKKYPDNLMSKQNNE